jgi:predicted Zn finger-like uncharacterized protein
MPADDAKPKAGQACPKCGNRLRLRPDQLGEQVRCPKCNATFTVGRPAPPKPAAPDDPYEPEIPLTRSSIVIEEPVMLEPDGPPPEIVPMQAPPTSHLPQYEADWATDDELEAEAPVRPPPRIEPDYLEIARRRGLLREDERQPVPQWTFFSGVFDFC